MALDRFTPGVDDAPVLISNPEDPIALSSERIPTGGWPAPRPIPWVAWLLAGAAVLAVGLGTVVRGFLGSDWFFTSDNLIRSLPPALPFAVGAAVLVGAFRWAGQRRLLLLAAGLFAVRGLLEVSVDALIVSWQSGTAAGPPPGGDALLFARYVVTELALAGAFAALALAMWRAGASGRALVPPIVLAAVGLVAALAVAGVGAAALVAWASVAPAARVIETAYWVFAMVPVAASATLAVSALRAAGPYPLPELLIGGASLLYLVARGAMDWVVATTQLQRVSPDLVLALARLETVALIALAIAFVSARLFPTREG